MEIDFENPIIYVLAVLGTILSGVMLFKMESASMGTKIFGIIISLPIAFLLSNFLINKEDYEGLKW